MGVIRGEGKKQKAKTVIRCMSQPQYPALQVLEPYIPRMKSLSVLFDYHGWTLHY